MPEVENTLLVNDISGDKEWDVAYNYDFVEFVWRVSPIYDAYRTVHRWRFVRRLILSWLWSGLDIPDGDNGASTPVSTSGLSCSNYRCTPTGDGIHCRYEETWVDETGGWSAWSLVSEDA